MHAPKKIFSGQHGTRSLHAHWRQPVFEGGSNLTERPTISAGCIFGQVVWTRASCRMGTPTLPKVRLAIPNISLWLTSCRKASVEPKRQTHTCSQHTSVMELANGAASQKRHLARACGHEQPRGFASHGERRRTSRTQVAGGGFLEASSQAAALLKPYALHHVELPAPHPVVVDGHRAVAPTRNHRCASLLDDKVSQRHSQASVAGLAWGPDAHATAVRPCQLGRAAWCRSRTDMGP